MPKCLTRFFCLLSLWSLSARPSTDPGRTRTIRLFFSIFFFSSPLPNETLFNHAKIDFGFSTCITEKKLHNILIRGVENVFLSKTNNKREILDGFGVRVQAVKNDHGQKNHSQYPLPDYPLCDPARCLPCLPEHNASVIAF